MPTDATSLSRLLFCSLFLTLAQPGGLYAESHWPQFRGTDGSGCTSETNLPVKWTPADVIWRTALEGQGNSSPCLWDKKIFVTTAAKQVDRTIERYLVCLDRGSGKVLWQKTVSTGNAEKNHNMNGFATPTCATDGERVVAFFGRGGIHCYDLKGTKLWSRELGDFPGPWGTAASPIIVDDKVIQNCDAQGDSSLVALDKTTGKTIWKTARQKMPRGGWNTPILIDTGSRKEIILNGEFGTNSYDPETGKDLWSCKGFSGRGTPSPIFGHNLVLIISGKPGDTFAVRPGGQGDITKTHMAWHTPRKSGRTLASPVLVQNYLLTINMGGDCICYDVLTGKELWKESLDGRYSASPIAASGLVYFQNEIGNAFVIKPGNKMTIIAGNEIGAEKGEIFRASPVPSDGQIFTRSDRAVYCIGAKGSQAQPSNL